MLFALPKSWKVRGASHQPVFMISCLTINHTCLPGLPGGRRVSPTCVLFPLTSGLMYNDSSVDVFLYGQCGFSSVESCCYSREWL